MYFKSATFDNHKNYNKSENFCTTEIFQATELARDYFYDYLIPANYSCFSLTLFVKFSYRRLTSFADCSWQMMIGSSRNFSGYS